MSKIKNEWHTDMPEALLYRRTLASSAQKTALNSMEFEKRGIEYGDVYRTTSRELATKNAEKFRATMSDPNDLRQWGHAMTAAKLGVEAFGMEVKESTEACFAMDMHYCPHLQGWIDAGCSDEMCAKLCDMAMEGDFAMARAMGYEMENPMRLADGDPVCRVIYRRRKD